jgi:hypothetical protein
MLIVALLLGLIATGHATADNSRCEQWRWIQPRPHANTFTTVAYGNGKFIAFGSFGVMASSSDGREWSLERRIAPVTSVTWTGEQFAAVGDHGLILTSPEGDTWTEQESPTNQRLISVAGNGNRMVAVGEWGTMVSSSDGESWSLIELGTTDTLSAAFWAGDRFLVMGGGLLLTSTDAVAWHQVPDSPPHLRCAASNGEVYIAGGATIWRSEDAEIWDEATVSHIGTSYPITGLVWTNGVFIAIQTDGQIHRSEDGYVWEVVHRRDRYPNNMELNALAASPDLWLAVGDDGATLTSTDGVVWLRPLLPATNDIRSVASNGDLIYTSGSRSSWIGSETTGWLYFPSTMAVWGGDRWVAISSNRSHVSMDGFTWTDHEFDFFNPMDIAWFDGQFVVLERPGRIYLSEDGASWSLAGETFGTFLALAGCPPCGRYRSARRHIIWKADRMVVGASRGSRLTAAEPAVPLDLIWELSSAIESEKRQQLGNGREDDHGESCTTTHCRAHLDTSGTLR